MHNIPAVFPIQNIQHMIRMLRTRECHTALSLYHVPGPNFKGIRYHSLPFFYYRDSTASGIPSLILRSYLFSCSFILLASGITSNVIFVSPSSVFVEYNVLEQQRILFLVWLIVSSLYGRMMTPDSPHDIVALNVCDESWRTLCFLIL